MKTILFTGTGSGIGFSTVTALARDGHHVFATMRNLARASELAALAEQEHLSITVLPLDVLSDDSVTTAVHHVLDARGTIDVLVNNAAIAPLGAFEETTLAAAREVMETNYFGTVRCIQAVLPGMRENKHGQIVNISSVASKLAIPGQSVYCASKAALEAMSECLASEVRPFNIKVSIVQPGVIDKADVVAGGGPGTSRYPSSRRLAAFFSAVVQQPVTASLVAETVRDIVTTEPEKIRHTVGAAAAGILAWRASLTDEQFVAIGALDEEAWCDYLQKHLGLNVRPYLHANRPAASPLPGPHAVAPPGIPPLAPNVGTTQNGGATA